MTASACGSACLLVVLMVLCSTTDHAEAGYEHSCQYNQQPHPNGLCGSRLADAVQSVCRARGKRGLKRGATSLSDFTKGGMSESISLKKREAVNFLVKRNTYQDIICECCYNKCDMHELEQYCP
ncbi:insulin-related peptide [Plakobranchus ocellatus]|uniref:Insulin-related peptide n=1 Tax=Plakobranchus ocellatus TaxID=259542 RepID=A0AAV4ATW9_9GAST|nr:insulin-related peptide [Plakobranchus ocellatus]